MSPVPMKSNRCTY